MSGAHIRNRSELRRELGVCMRNTKESPRKYKLDNATNEKSALLWLCVTLTAVAAAATLLVDHPQTAAGRAGDEWLGG